MQTFDEWLISRLRAAGAYAGLSDGAFGRSVIEALQRYQRAEGLPVTGQADTATVERLQNMEAPRATPVAPPTTSPEPPWMREARRYMGIKEIPGPKSNPTILGFAKKLGGWVASYYTNDDTAWCGLFVGNCIAITLPSEPLPANPLGALEWNKFGTAVQIPAVGAIMTFTRTGGGHVGMYVGEDADAFHILGGNQANSVSITRVAKNRLAGIRWPKSVPMVSGKRVMMTAAGSPLSSNEA